MNHRRNRILLLDSDEQVLIELEQQLEDCGFETTTTWDPAEALRLAESRHFDLFLLGDHPPEITASEMLRDLQCRPVNIPCLILQVGHSPFEEQYFCSLGASGVIPNWRSVDLARVVQNWFGARRNAAAV